MAKLIVLDPGHGGWDSGAAANGMREKDLTLDIAARTEPRLKAHGFQVLMTRKADVYVSLSQRAEQANRAKADYFLSLHINAGGGTGFESYIFSGFYSDKGETERIRRAIHRMAAAHFQAHGMPDRGRKEADFAVLRKTVMPSSLLELGFIDRFPDASNIQNPRFRQGTAEAIVKGICQAFGVTYRPPSSTVWVVQTGAFEHREGAEQLAKELREKGYAAVVKESTGG